MKKIFAVVAVENESDIIESFVRYNLTYCDGMIIYVNESYDNTFEIIESLVAENLPIYMYHDPNDICGPFKAGSVKDAMMHRAFHDYGADLVVPLDADEFLQHVDGINPRGVLEKLDDGVEYRILRRTYIYESEPKAELGFIPRNFKRYRNPEDEIFISAIASRELVMQKQAHFASDTSLLEFPSKHRALVPIEQLSELVLSHFPLRSKTQLMAGAIDQYITDLKKPLSNKLIFGSASHNYEAIISEVIEKGDIPYEQVAGLSAQYGIKGSTSEKLSSNLEYKESVEGQMDVSYCSDKLGLRYTDCQGYEMNFFRKVLTDIESSLGATSKKEWEAIQSLANTTNENNNHIWYNRSLSDQNNDLVNQNNILSNEIDALSDEISTLSGENNDLSNQIDDLYRSNFLKAGELLQSMFRLYQEENTALEEENRQLDELVKFGQHKRRALLEENQRLDYSRIQEKNLIVANVTSAVDALLATRTFKLIHFWSRIKYQLLKGSFSEKKAFIRWFFGRLRGTPHIANSYNPLMRILDVVNESANIPSPVPEAHNSLLEVVNEPANTPSPMQEAHNPLLEQEYRKFDVIVLSIIAYNFRHQRPQHIASRFAADGHRVFYFNVDFYSEFSIEKEDENLYIVNISNIMLPNIYQTDWADNLDELQKEFDKVLHPFAVRDAIVIVDYPNWVHGAMQLRKKFGFKILTDFMDEFTGFKNNQVDMLAKNCITLLRESDFVVASSQYLYDSAIKYNQNVELIRNGTEYEHFAKASSKNRTTGKPIIGYYGAISHWFGADIVCYIAENLPDCDIVLIGEVTVFQEQLQKHQNIQLLGEKPYNELPSYLENFDVCLIPFDTSTDLIKATNPVKFYEYLSAGKKIVATEIPELEDYRDDYVLMANEKHLFLEHVKSCLNGTDGLKDKRSLMAMGKANSWDCRFQDMMRCSRLMSPKVSVVVLTYNNLEQNKLCIESILSQTAYPNYELIVVDNLSQDGTREYLTELQQQDIPNLKIILNNQNLGFAGGNNIGIKESDGSYVILLNNDTIVTRGWMTAFVKHPENDATMGMSGAVSNSIGNEAKIPTDYSTITELRNFAFRYTWDHMGETYLHEPRVLAMFAICIKREVIDKCGLLDESYTTGMFEDDDYSLAVRNEGYRLCIAEDAFIHHFDGSTFKSLDKKDYSDLFDKNKEIFERKWSTQWKGHKYRDGVGVECGGIITI